MQLPRPAIGELSVVHAAARPRVGLESPQPGQPRGGVERGESHYLRLCCGRRLRVGGERRVARSRARDQNRVALA